MLQVGSLAPDFSAKDQHGRSVRLKDFRGKKVVLYFYPQDFTPTCTTQACNLRDHYQTLSKKGYVVIGVSPQDVASHQKFAERHQLPFILLADPDQTIIKKYGVWGEKSLYGRRYMGVFRTTFVIDENGRIEKIISKVKAKEHAAQILESEA
ncbi:MAG: thioredoxin-dependent thiol peroxidase [Chitinophagales bacterium]|nr:thioredoxin-dependent thiol peroxidase [Chitinophagales bacterium]MDW8428854.1 thioredoxin-dependent thiol peroxidase [Chitinophagales bacterium]